MFQSLVANAIGEFSVVDFIFLQLRIGFIFLSAQILLFFLQGSASHRHFYTILAAFAIVLIPVLLPVGPTIYITPPTYTPQYIFNQTLLVDSKESPLFSWVAFFVAFYFLVAAGLLLSLLKDIALNFHITRRHSVPPSKQWLAMLKECQRELGIKIPVKLYFNATVRTPLMWGMLKPVVLIPRQAQHWSPDLIRHCLLHELAHVKRFDWFTQQLLRIICAIFWINPFCWVLQKQLNILAEQAADDLVIVQQKVKSSEYVESLLTVVRSTSSEISSTLSTPCSAVGMAGDNGSVLFRRLCDALYPFVNREIITKTQGLVAGAIVFLFLLPVSILQSEYRYPSVNERMPVNPPSLAYRTAFSPPSSLDKPAAIPLTPYDTKRFTLPKPYREKETPPNESDNNTITDKKSNADFSKFERLGTQSDHRVGLSQEGIEDARDSSEAISFNQSAYQKAVNPQNSASSIDFDFTKSTNTIPSNSFAALIQRMSEQKTGLSEFAYRKRILPKYPRKALRKGIEGRVVVSFSIDRSGNAYNISVRDSYPKGFFDASVIQAVGASQFDITAMNPQSFTNATAQEVFHFVIEG